MLLVLGRRLFFDPLSKFPGPWLNAVSDIPAALRLISGRQHAYHRRLHEKYGTVANPAPNRHSRRTGIIADFNADFFYFSKGPVVRVSPNELIFCCADAWDDIYGNKVSLLLQRLRAVIVNHNLTRSFVRAKKSSRGKGTWKSLLYKLAGFLPARGRPL